MSLFDEIYNLTYLPIVTPNNLLDNFKYDSYNSILFKKVKTGLLAEINCTINNDNITFFIHNLLSFTRRNPLINSFLAMITIH